MANTSHPDSFKSAATLTSGSQAFAAAVFAADFVGEFVAL